jgi:primosomal protein N'
MPLRLFSTSQPPYDWETGSIENTCDDRATVETEIESILSILSEDEDVPTSDAASLNAFLKKAVSNMKEVLKRGRDAALRGVKGNYAVKVGQRQSRWTENEKKQRKVAALREGIRGGNQITNWFQKKPPAHEHDLMIGASISQSLVARSVVTEPEVENSSEEEPSLPPSTQASTQAPSPIGSLSSENGSKRDITQLSSVNE